jgi:hypothetical protein
MDPRASGTNCVNPQTPEYAAGTGGEDRQGRRPLLVIDGTGIRGYVRASVSETFARSLFKRYSRAFCYSAPTDPFQFKQEGRRGDIVCACIPRQRRHSLFVQHFCSTAASLGVFEIGTDREAGPNPCRGRRSMAWTVQGLLNLSTHITICTLDPPGSILAVPVRTGGASARANSTPG